MYRLTGITRPVPVLRPPPTVRCVTVACGNLKVWPNLNAARVTGWLQRLGRTARAARQLGGKR